jgi:hypothetical protein
MSGMQKILRELYWYLSRLRRNTLLVVSRFRKLIVFKLFKNDLVTIHGPNKRKTQGGKGRKILCLYFDGIPAKRLELYGGPIPCPNFTRVASGGTNYTNMIVTAPSTAMSLTTMFTGLFPHEFGRRSWVVKDKNLPDHCIPLIEELERDDYHISFLWDESFMARRSQNKYKILDWEKYDVEFFDIADKEIQAEQTIGLVKEIDKVHDQWFCYVRFSDGSSPRFNGAAAKYSPYTFDDEIVEADQILGEILNNVPKGTDLIILSDHGKAYGQNGIYKYAFNLSEMTLHVPFITSWGDGKIESDLVSMAEFPNIVKGEPLRQHKYLYADSGYADQWIRSTMIRLGRWKYVYNRTGWRYPEELYDLKFDSLEQINLAGRYVDPYRDSRPKGDSVDIKNSPSGQVLDGKPVREVYPRNDWDRIEKILEELRLERERIWEAQGVSEKNYD